MLYHTEEQTPQVLLIRRDEVWDLPKGKLEKNESIEECAVREVAEETGVPIPKLNSFLCETYHEYVREGVKFGKTTYWYAMKTNTVEGLTPQREEGITELLWTDLEKAINIVGYENLTKVLRSFKEFVKANRNLFK